MIAVYVREPEESAGQLLGNFQLSELPRLVQKFNEYPTYFKDTGNLGTESAVGQFVSGNNEGCYFEIVVSVEDVKDQETDNG